MSCYGLELMTHRWSEDVSLLLLAQLLHDQLPTAEAQPLMALPAIYDGVRQWLVLYGV